MMREGKEENIYYLSGSLGFLLISLTQWYQKQQNLFKLLW